MKIAASMVSLSSQQTNITSSSAHSYLRKWNTNTETIETTHAENKKRISQSRELFDRLQINPKHLLTSQTNHHHKTEKEKDLIGDYKDEFFGDIKLKIFKDLIEMFTGTEIKVFQPKECLEGEGSAEVESDLSSTKLPSSVPPKAPISVGWGIDYFYRETKYHKEGFSFEAAGKVITDTGKEITFNTSLSLSRESYEELTVSLKAGDALIDPLMINFSGNGAAISNIKFEFDLNFDGLTDLIPTPAPGTGFLAYDKNGDGIINDGSELFGPSTNDGFAELAGFDDDNNGWIDENDLVFSSLSIWEKNNDGTDRLSKLLDKFVGAIYTGRVDTKFDIVNPAKALDGSIRQSGIWLNEKTGSAGIIQEIDLVV